MATNEQAPWGRVGDDGTVYVREADGERAVGQYPDATPEEALAYYERKFAELAGPGRPARAARARRRARGRRREGDHAPHRVGRDGQRGRRPRRAERPPREARRQRRRTDREAVGRGEGGRRPSALAEREALVAEAEALAAQDPAKAQWKQVTTQLDALFARWQAAQKDGPRLPKNESNELWKRFRAARTTIEAHRKAFFTELDGVHKEARSRKQELVEQRRGARAEGHRGDPRLPPPARRVEARRPRGQARRRRALGALQGRRRRALRGEGRGRRARERGVRRQPRPRSSRCSTRPRRSSTETDREKAKSTLLGIQRRWDAIGKVPRDSIRTVEDRLRKVETHVRKLDEDHWNKSDPEKQARSQGFAAQLEAKIAKLEAELAEAKAKGDARKVKDAEDAIAAAAHLARRPRLDSSTRILVQLFLRS